MRAVRSLVSSGREQSVIIPAYSRIATALRGISGTLPLRSENGADRNNDASEGSGRTPASSAWGSNVAGGAASSAVSRGASFANSLRPGKAGGTPSPRDGPAGLYTHTIVTKEDKSPAGVAVPVSSTTPASSPPASDGPPTSRRRNSTVPLRVTKSASSGGGGQLDAPHAAVAALKGSAPSTVSFSAGSTSATSHGVALHESIPKDVKTAARPQDGPTVPDYGPLRATGLWSVDEVLDEAKKTVDFRRIDDVESDIVEELKSPEAALVPYEEEEKWKHKLMFEYKFKKTPKHLTWKELGEEIECMDCVIEPDEHRPEEIFTISFFFTDKKTGTRDAVWTTRNDVSYSEGFTDLLAAVGACLGRSDVHRTIRFDDGAGCTRDVTFRKRSRYTSDVYVAFRPPEKYNKFERKEEQDEYEASMEKEGMSTWGYHPSLMDPEFSELDFKDPEGTYEVAISAHGFAFIILRAVNRLLARPMKDFYRPSQLMRTAKVKTEDEIGFMHAMKGWMGVDEQLYPHYTPIEALQDHWLGKDAPFSLCSIVNKIREMDYLKKENPEFQSWLSVRHHDTHLAIRNMGVKLLGVGASTLFVPVQHNATVNRLLPKPQQRRLESKFSLNAVLGLPDETRKLEGFKQITGLDRITDAPTTPEKSPEASAVKTESASPGK
ncbi:putative mitochondrial hypothetical protein [Leptomonas pyrrhocoris]|uniref:Uncharacterized protein n=1 Tax=Leptomonas pyrrhocoris TaxID=157538 RepID=A0A0M9G847_LEPPY|nr:putative mitochondrial hypothetical protein [Leptomonas pyrrhocoris]KPA84690.1 putative mitochondrial hypothetical protein [Leptomonas pyrrhocoris]|eukprot:XP_015663129.1 putative mitochondrial hypothetical protein [Leptomonas pyrrhocoris]